MITGNEKEVRKYLPDIFYFCFGYGSSEDSEGCKASWGKMVFLKRKSSRQKYPRFQDTSYGYISDIFNKCHFEFSLKSERKCTGN